MRCTLKTVPLIILLLVVLLALPCLALEEALFEERYLQEPVFGSQIYLREAGRSNAELLLLIHGVGDEAGRCWDQLLPELAQKYHVVVPDLPGFGRSSKGNHLYSPDAYATFLDWLIKDLPKKPVNLVGHSLGGGISLSYAAHHGRKLKRLVLIDSVGALHYLSVSQNFVQKLALDKLLIPPVSGPLGKITNLILEKTTRIPFSPDFILSTAFMRKRFLAADPARIAGLALVQTDYSLLLGQIDVPTWLIWGDADKIAPLRVGKVLHWTLPRSELVVLPGGGHVPMAEDHKQSTAVILRSLQTLPHVRKSQWLDSNGRKGSCEGKRGTVFEGAFDEISISSCDEVVLKNVTVRKLQITDSDVTIERSYLLGHQGEPAMIATRSHVSLTAVDIVAETGVLTDQSRLDLAGVRFIKSVSAIRATGNPSAVLCSSSTKSHGGKVTALHVSRSLDSGESL